MRALAAALALAAPVAFALTAPIPPFSALAPGPALPGGWREERLPRIPPAEIRLVRDEATTVLRVRSQAGSGAAIHKLATPQPAPAHLAWRWKVERLLERADMTRKEGDDFAARVYVFFDVPEDTLDLGTRVKMRLARLIHGAEIPTAALCYVWDNRQAPGFTAWNPYTDRVRMVVLRSREAPTGRWVEERRDLAADFRAAFGAQWAGPVPAVTGVAVGNDTDQTLESATAWFGDLRLEPSP